MRSETGPGSLKIKQPIGVGADEAGGGSRLAFRDRRDAGRWDREGPSDRKVMLKLKLRVCKALTRNSRRLNASLTSEIRLSEK